MICVECKRKIEDHEKVWVKVTGWEAKRSQGGTNHIALRERQEEFMCNGCMTLLQSGISTKQGRLI